MAQFLCNGPHPIYATGGNRLVEPHTKIYRALKEPLYVNMVRLVASLIPSGVNKSYALVNLNIAITDYLTVTELLSKLLCNFTIS